MEGFFVSVLIMMGAFNLINGTMSFVYNVVSMRQRMLFSRFSALYQVTMAMLHLILWLGAMSIYLGIVTEDEEEGDIVQVKKVPVIIDVLNEDEENVKSNGRKRDI